MLSSSLISFRRLALPGRLVRGFVRLPAWFGAILGVLIGAGLAALFLMQLDGLEGSLGYAALLSLAFWLAFRAGWVVDLKLQESPVPVREGAVAPTEPEALPRVEKQPQRPKPLLEMVEIPGGRFLMGSPADDDSAYESEFPQHPVTIGSFLMSRYPVTVADYRSIMDDAPAEWNDNRAGDRCSANYINWLQAVEFCNALSKREGLEPCYPIDSKSVKWSREANGYRLPTEAEWEYAARGGSENRYFFGDDPAPLGDYAWYSGNSGRRIHPIGKLKPNPFGLYDLRDNV